MGGGRQEHFEIKRDEISHALRAGQRTYVLIVSSNENKENINEQQSDTTGEYHERI